MLSNSPQSIDYRQRWNSFPQQSKTNRINKLLADADPKVKREFKWDDEGLWSMTHHKISEELAQKLLSLSGMKSSSIITDTMSSIGGNTIPFAKVFQHVNAIELDSCRTKMLKHNIGLFGLTNITIYRDYYQNVISDLQQDCVYFDPPWGIDYKKYDKLTLDIGAPGGRMVPIEDAICALEDSAKYAMVKLPLNYDMEYFKNNIAGVCSIVAQKEYPRPNSMKAVIVRY